MSEIIKIAKGVFNSEIKELENLSKSIGNNFDGAVRYILSIKGKVVVTGIGKSGIIGKKISSSLSSTGTKSFFIHPVEAIHGDLGMLNEHDVVIAISNSGETEEVLKIVPFLKQNSIKIISLTGNLDSTLALNSDYTLSIYVKNEACPLNLAPTSSTTAALVVGDAITVSLMKLRGFSKEDFSEFHPGGSLGKKLLVHVGQVMIKRNLPFVSPRSSITNLLVKMSEGKIGMALIGSSDNLFGIITDGDIRRGIVNSGSVSDMNIENIINKSPIICDYYEKLNVVDDLMLKKKISTVLIKKSNHIVGVHQIYD